MSAEIEVRVECYAGYRAEQYPQRFTLGQRLFEVKEIIDQWQGPDYRYFKLRADDNGIYILRHDERTDKWQLTMFDTAVSNTTRLSST